MRFPSRRRTDFAPRSALWTRSLCWTKSGPFTIISPPSPRGRRSIRCRNATPTSTGSCGASRSPGGPARCGRRIRLGRDHPDTGALGGIRSKRSGLASSSGLKPNRTGPRRSSSTACAGNSPGRSSPASFARCSAASATGVAWPLVSSSSIRRRHPRRRSRLGAKLLERLNARPFRKLPGSRRSQFEQLDRPALRPLPDTPYYGRKRASAGLRRANGFAVPVAPAGRLPLSTGHKLCPPIHEAASLLEQGSSAESVGKKP